MLYQRLKRTDEQMNPAPLLRSLNAAEKAAAKKSASPNALGTLLLAHSELALLHSLRDEVSAARPHIVAVAPIAERLFAGPPTKKSPALATWMDPFRHALLWGAVQGTWPALAAWAAFATPALAPNTGRTEQEKHFLLALAAHLRGEERAAITPVLNRAFFGRHKRSLMAAAVLDSLLRLDPRGYQMNLYEFILYFRRTEFEEKTFAGALSVEASIFHRLGERAGFPFRAPSWYMDNLIRLPSLT